ncbi:hypothetical protein CERZMDRAFT_97825 [Cercospora zeae-maydis SCOH1-5]|uniref:F-box domain-containing protein n=1 Tax=Cercospora zeae-maydis SCOH1-5 TaxID=717836 RepID=A0A6A6FET1_9PEZI|nr:hypothetical protein CERZMDRAFT_97825 [Cercospora zeae-maydis SCOH1-5]
MQDRIPGKPFEGLVNYLQRDTFVRPLLQACSGRLTFLEFTAEDSGLVRPSPGFDGLSVDHIPIQESALFLANVLFPMHFPALKHLELRGWPFTVQDIEAFLNTMRSTLRKLRLIDNIILDTCSYT